MILEDVELEKLPGRVEHALTKLSAEAKEECDTFLSDLKGDEALQDEVSRYDAILQKANELGNRDPISAEDRQTNLTKKLYLLNQLKPPANGTRMSHRVGFINFKKTETLKELDKPFLPRQRQASEAPLTRNPARISIEATELNKLLFTFLNYEEVLTNTTPQPRDTSSELESKLKIIQKEIDNRVKFITNLPLPEDAETIHARHYTATIETYKKQITNLKQRITEINEALKNPIPSESAGRAASEDLEAITVAIATPAEEVMNMLAASEGAAPSLPPLPESEKMRKLKDQINNIDIEIKNKEGRLITGANQSQASKNKEILAEISVLNNTKASLQEELKALPLKENDRRMGIINNIFTKNYAHLKLKDRQQLVRIELEKAMKLVNKLVPIEGTDYTLSTIAQLKQIIAQLQQSNLDNVIF